MTFAISHCTAPTACFPALQQAGVRYHWDGEETFGMLERSNPLDKITG
jgi:hypothetical protein